MLTFLGVRAAGQAIVLYQSMGDRGFSYLANAVGDPSDAYEWGYGGAGPRLLAEALLFSVCHDRVVARRLGQEFKWAKIAKLPSSYWMVHQEEVEAWIIGRVSQLSEVEVADLLEHGEEEQS